MINRFWRLVAKLLARPAIADWLIARAQRTPYLHIMSADGAEMYMGRWWLFNPYSRETHKPALWWCPWSFRIHHIMRPDEDRDLHDHPWNARTIILRGWYREQRLLRADDPALHQLLMSASEHGLPLDTAFQAAEYIDSLPGDTARLQHGEYHRIDTVSPGGVITLFITSKWRGDWGFLVNGVKVPWRTYTGTDN
ncbi:hypothetical protein SRABI130_02841 [Pseudomonas sp. Bi130]|uniref:hypothetical protein n=1 Tax=Pseudomonas sp. Bi130 TaxID=2821122 RepID=UPI001D9897F1|nr:hypothetical protein [Pseudomonas sp. Bi130]CAH0234944.1 hypothetical protein SRABI130_02841 [Pseudomonas sp. Bi130]